MINTAVDLTGKEFKVGDKVAYGDTTSTNNAVICFGEIKAIEKHGIQTHIIVNKIKNGGWRTYKQTRTFIFPRKYHNLLIL